MAWRLDEKKVSEIVGKYRGVAIRAGRRAEMIEQRAEKFAAGVIATFEVTGMAFGMGFLRGYYGPKAVVWEIPIDAGAALLLHGLAFGLGLTGGRYAEIAASNLHNLANGAMATWAASMGAELGMKKRPTDPALPAGPEPPPPTAPVSAGVQAGAVALPPAQPPQWPQPQGALGPTAGAAPPMPQWSQPQPQPQWGPQWPQQEANPMTQEELAAAMQWRGTPT